MVDLNATQAFIRAGYSEKNANVNSARMMANDSIKARIQELHKKMAEKLEITAERIKEELATIAFSSITDFVAVEDFTITTGTKRKKTKIVRAVTVFKTADVPKHLHPAISQIQQTQHGISIKVHDKVQALELLGKHLGFFAEDNKTKQLNISINGKKVIKRAS